MRNTNSVDNSSHSMNAIEKRIIETRIRNKIKILDEYIKARARNGCSGLNDYWNSQCDYFPYNVPDSILEALCYMSDFIKSLCDLDDTCKSLDTLQSIANIHPTMLVNIISCGNQDASILSKAYDKITSFDSALAGNFEMLKHFDRWEMSLYIESRSADEGHTDGGQEHDDNAYMTRMKERFETFDSELSVLSGAIGLWRKEFDVDRGMSIVSVNWMNVNTKNIGELSGIADLTGLSSKIDAYYSGMPLSDLALSMTI